MEEETLLAMVNRWLHADEETLWRAVRSTLETLAERLDKNESRHPAAELPERIAPFLFTGTPAESFDVEFVRRAAQRVGVAVGTAQFHAEAVFAAPPEVDAATAKRHVGAFMTTLRTAVGADQYFDLAVELPPSLVTMLGVG